MIRERVFNGRPGFLMFFLFLAVFLAAVAGLILSGYIGTGSLGLGDGRNLDSIASSVVGGPLSSCTGADSP